MERKIWKVVGFYKVKVDDPWQPITDLALMAEIPLNDCAAGLKLKYKADYVIFTIKEVKLDGTPSGK